jgi:cytoskeletal protein CcmA (bactofilin family)
MLEASESAANAQRSGSGLGSQYGIGFGSATEQATLGSTVVVKGELRGSQPLFIDGRVEGSIHFAGHRVTIGRGAVVLANIEAKEAVIMGTVTGNVNCTDRVDVRSEAVLTGDVVTQRISIDSGAMVKGVVEVRKSKVWEAAAEQKMEQVDPAKEMAPVKEETAKAKEEGRLNSSSTLAGTSVEGTKTTETSNTGPRSTSRVAGSKVLFVEQKAGSR